MKTDWTLRENLEVLWKFSGNLGKFRGAIGSKRNDEEEIQHN